MAQVSPTSPGSRVVTQSDSSIIGQVVVNPDGSTVGGGVTQKTTSSASTPGTTDATVFTLSSGQVGSIQNLAAAALYVKLGASASSSSFTYVLPACTTQDDGTSPPVYIDFWSGAVSVAAASGTARYLATKLS